MNIIRFIYPIPLPSRGRRASSSSISVLAEAGIQIYLGYRGGLILSALFETGGRVRGGSWGRVDQTSEGLEAKEVRVLQA